MTINTLYKLKANVYSYSKMYFINEVYSSYLKCVKYTTSIHEVYIHVNNIMLILWTIVDCVYVVMIGEGVSTESDEDCSITAN